MKTHIPRSKVLQRMTTYMSKYDKILMGAVLALSLLSYLVLSPGSQGNAVLTAEISVNGSTVTTIDLTNPAPRLIDISGPLGTSVAEVKPGAILMKTSPCPDHYCMKTGWIDRPGQVIACVPNRIIIKISPQASQVDAISR
jgi:hypothetical protein